MSMFKTYAWYGHGIAFWFKAVVSELSTTTVFFRYLQLMDEQDQIERDLRYLLEMKGKTEVLKVYIRNPFCNC